MRSWCHLSTLARYVFWLHTNRWIKSKLERKKKQCGKKIPQSSSNGNQRAVWTIFLNMEGKQNAFTLRHKAKSKPSNQKIISSQTGSSLPETANCKICSANTSGPEKKPLKVTGNSFDLHDVVEDCVCGGADFPAKLLSLRWAHHEKRPQQLPVQNVPYRKM